MTNSHSSLSQLHGGEVEWAVSERYGIPVSEIVSFASTVSPVVPATVRNLAARFDDLYLYPAKDHRKLKEVLARHHKIDVSASIILGSGSTELIHLFAQVTSPGEAIIPIPTYSEYESAVTKYRSKPVFVGPTADFDIDVDAIERNISKRTRAIFVCNPNNPTGRLYDRRKMKLLADLARENDIPLLVDEAYMCFTPASKKYSMVSLVKTHPVLVLNSLSKLFGVPSIRLGWGIGSEDIVRELEKFKIPWNVSNLAIWAGEELLVDLSYQEMISKLIALQRDELCEKLEGFSWMKVFKTDCNFMLTEILRKGMNSTVVFDRLVAKGLVVRDCSSIRGLGDKYVRFTIRTRGDNNRLIAGLRGIEPEVIQQEVRP